VGAVLLLLSASRTEAEVLFGLKGGFVHAGVSPKEIGGGVAELEDKWGPGVGAFATWAVNENLGLRMELLYLSKGVSLGESEGTDAAGNPTGSFETLIPADYVELPLLIEYGWPAGPAWRPVLSFGGAVGFEIQEQMVLRGAQEASFDSDRFSTTDFGLTAGAEIRMKAGSGWALLEGRYTHGLMEVADGFSTEPAKNRAFMVLAGYIF
jgi:hypothetical protein